jgi:hypothetical protein
VYARTVEEKVIELAVSGKLYKDALVMYDRETDTLWTQVDGSALRGPLEGRQLEPFPARQTTWGVWKRLHPNTVALTKPAGIRGSPYADYFTDPERRGLFGTRGSEKLEGKAMVVGVHAGDDAVAVPVNKLERKPVAQFDLAGEPMVVYYGRAEKTAAAYSARVEDRVLLFRVTTHDGREWLEDEQTKSRWDPLLGRAVAGPYEGQQLESLAYLHSYWYAWSAYQRETRLVEP